MRVRLGLVCVCAVAISTLAFGSFAAGATHPAASSPGTASITSGVNDSIRGALCRVWEDYCDGPWYCQVSTRLRANCQPSKIWGALFYERWILYVSLALAALFLIILAVELRPLRADPEDPLKVSSGLNDFQLHYAYGEVENVERVTDTTYWTDVHANAYGGVRVSSGSSSSSRTVAKVVARNGRVRFVETGDIPLNIGSDLYSLWAIKDGERTGPFILHVNCFNRSVFTLGTLAQFVRVDFAPIVFVAAAQGLVLRWFSIFTIPLTALLWWLFAETLTELRKDKLMEHLNQKVLPKTLPRRV